VNLKTIKERELTYLVFFFLGGWQCGVHVVTAFAGD